MPGQRCHQTIRPSSSTRSSLLLRRPSRSPGMVSRHARFDPRDEAAPAPGWERSGSAAGGRTRRRPQRSRRAPEQLALEPFEAIAVPLHGARTPGPGHTGVDGGVVRVEPRGNAPHGLQRPVGRPLQPRLERRRLPVAPQGGTGLHARQRLVHLGLWRAPLGARGCRVCWALRLASEHQPGRPARGQGLVRGLSHDRPRRPRAAWSGSQALGLPPTAGRGGDEAIAPGVAPSLAVATPPPRGAAARVPTRQHHRVVWGQEPGATVTPRLASRAGGRAAIPLDGAQTHPDRPRHRPDGPPVAGHGPALRIRRLPARLALGRARLGRRGRAWGGGTGTATVPSDTGTGC
jgi:hypothetical protein